MSDLITTILIATGIAVLASAVMGPFLIPLLARLKAGQVIRGDGPERHLGKAGTPTMGGLMIIAALIVASLTMGGQSREVVLCLAVTLAFGLIGFADDYIKVVLKRSLGLRAREKLIMQFFFGMLFSIYLVFGLSRGTEIVVPFSGYVIDLGWVYFPFIILAIMGFANGVNLTDGLDGLAAGSTFLVALGLTIVCLMTSHSYLAVFTGSLAGACIGFLIFNRHPAQVFMGDTGSMALGGAVAAVAAVTHTELALLIIGGIYVIETLSVTLQVISFQTTGKRMFLMAPLHHHFELKGWSETKVVRVFWFVTLTLVVLGLLGFRNIG